MKIRCSVIEVSNVNVEDEVRRNEFKRHVCRDSLELAFLLGSRKLEDSGMRQFKVASRIERPDFNCLYADASADPPESTM